MAISLYNLFGSRLWLCAAAAVLIVLRPLAPLAAPGADPPVSSHDKEVETFLHTVRTIVDRALLFHPDQLATTLGVTIRGHVDKELLAKECSEGASSRVLRTYEIENAWFKARPERLSKVPPPVVNSGDPAQEPQIAFSAFAETRCFNAQPVQTKSARLRFQNIEEFGCVTTDMLAKQLDAQLISGLFGAVHAFYAGSGNDGFGIKAEFSFPHFATGGACAVNLFIEQDERLGYRQLRASQKHRACAEHAMSEFCAKTPDVKPGEASRLRDYANKVCGSEVSFVHKEPWSGEPPPPLPESAHRDYSKGPCAGR